MYLISRHVEEGFCPRAGQRIRIDALGRKATPPQDLTFWEHHLPWAHGKIHQNPEQINRQDKVDGRPGGLVVESAC